MTNTPRDQFLKMVDDKSYARPVNRDLLILVTVCVFGCFSFPEIIVSKFSLPLPYFSNRLPYVAPLLILLLWVLLTECSQTKKVIVPIAWPELLFLMNLVVWLSIEMLHSSDKLNVSIHIMEFLAPQIWLFLFYYIFKLVVENIGIPQQLYLLFLLVPTLCCILQLLSYVNIIPGSWVSLEHILRGDRPEGYHLNLTSYLALFGIWLLLFIDGKWRKWSWEEWAPTLLFILFLLIIAINRTRGALLLLALLFGLKFYEGFGKPARIIIWILGAMALCALLLKYHLSMNFYSIALIDDDSIRQRIGSVFTAIHNNTSSMFTGLGSGKSQSLTFEGMKPHTYHIRIFSSFGFLGLLSFMLSIVSLFYLVGISWRMTTISGFFIINGMMLLEPELHWWYAVIPIAVIMNHRKHLKCMA